MYTYNLTLTLTLTNIHCILVEYTLHIPQYRGLYSASFMPSRSPVQYSLYPYLWDNGVSVSRGTCWRKTLFNIAGRIARTWRYDLKFHGNLSYVRFPKITPLPQCTVCWWMLLNVRHDRFKTVFSYQSLATNEQIIEFAVKSDGSFRLTVGVDER